jgi:hypothetical protein
MGVRRVVTGHDKDGRSIIVSDEFDGHPLRPHLWGDTGLGCAFT